MNPKSAAIALRLVAEQLDRARQIARDLPARFVDDESAMCLFFDAPRVVLALAAIAGSLDPVGDSDDDDALDLVELARLPITRENVTANIGLA